MEHEIGPQHARDRAGGTQAWRERRLARAIERHEGERRDDAGGQIEEQVFHMPHVVLDIIAEDPQKPHVAGQVHDTAVHEDRRQQRHPRRNRCGLEAGIGHLDHALGRLDHSHRRLGDDVSPRDDLGGHLAIGERDVVVGPHLLEHHEHKHVRQQQRDRHIRKDCAVRVVVTDGKDHSRPPEATHPATIASNTKCPFAPSPETAQFRVGETVVKCEYRNGLSRPPHGGWTFARHGTILTAAGADGISSMEGSTHEQPHLSAPIDRSVSAVAWHSATFRGRSQPSFHDVHGGTPRITADDVG